MTGEVAGVVVRFRTNKFGLISRRGPSCMHSARGVERMRSRHCDVLLLCHITPITGKFVECLEVYLKYSVVRIVAFCNSVCLSQTTSRSWSGKHTWHSNQVRVQQGEMGKCSFWAGLRASELDWLNLSPVDPVHQFIVFPTRQKNKTLAHQHTTTHYSYASSPWNETLRSRYDGSHSSSGHRGVTLRLSRGEMHVDTLWVTAALEHWRDFKKVADPPADTAHVSLSVQTNTLNV